MSKQVDWSQAPEGATVLLKHVRDNSYAWAVSHADESDAWIVDGTCFGFRLMAYCWRVVSKRPITPSWSGGGLPPVGVVCEYTDLHGVKWYGCEIIAHHGEHVWLRTTTAKRDHVKIASAFRFRPIRTPEQIAADDRQKMVDMLWQRYLQPILAPAQEAQVKTALGLIYDDFYRKP